MTIPERSVELGSDVICEMFKLAHVAGDDNRIAFSDYSFRLGVDELFSRGLHTDHVDPETMARLALIDRLPVEFLRGAHFHNGEVIVELDEIQHLA